MESWDDMMRGVSDAVRKIEDATDEHESGLSMFDGLVRRVLRGEVTEDLLKGLTLGLALGDGAMWLRNTPSDVEEIRQQLRAHDDRVSQGELPAAAHSWRYQVQARLDALGDRLTGLSKAFDESRRQLSRLVARESSDA